MALTASAKSTTVSTPAPVGNHVARCVRVIDLGTQKEDGLYGVKVQPKLMLTWELPEELHTFKEENGPEPFVVTKEYTMSLGEKASLRAALESWRGKAFTALELEAFDISKLLGAPCLLNVIHKAGKDGQLRARVGGITPMPKGMKCPEPKIALIKYEIEEGKGDAFKKLPEWVQNKIAACENWKAKPAASESTTEPDPSDFNPDGAPDELSSEAGF